MSSHYNALHQTMSDFKADQWNEYVQWWAEQNGTTNLLKGACLDFMSPYKNPYKHCILTTKTESKGVLKCKKYFEMIQAHQGKREIKQDEQQKNMKYFLSSFLKFFNSYVKRCQTFR